MFTLKLKKVKNLITMNRSSMTHQMGMSGLDRERDKGEYKKTKVETELH